MPVPPPTFPSGTAPDARGTESLESVPGFYVKAVDIVQPAIISLRHNRQRPWLKEKVFLCLPLNDRVPNDAHAVSVGDRDGTFEKPGFFHPRRTGHLAVAVERKPAGEDGIF